MASNSGPQATKQTTIDLVGGIYCNICHLTFNNKKDYDTHYSQHNLGKDEIVYTCVICYKDIAGYPSFRGHCYTRHVIKDRYKCEYCHKLFSKLSSLNDHISALHKFECSSCNREFPTRKELKLHKIIHMNDKPPFNCQACNEKVDSVDTCELHIDQHSVSLYSCPICSEKIDSKTDAVDHLTIHFGTVLNNSKENDDSDSEYDKPEDSSIDLLGGILCKICNLMYKNRAEIDSHYSQDHPEMSVTYGCDICRKDFEKYTQFANHCYEHINKNRFKCESCDKSFSRLARLVTHTEAFHTSPVAGRKPLACHVCEQHFASEYRYREHQRVEHNICMLVCSQPRCGKIFETPKELVLHKKQHKLSSELWCRLCGLQFHSRGAAERHLDVHRKKTFSCPICARKYGEKYLLMKHVPQHFETVIHMCKVCGNLYNAKNRLIEHSKTHANVKNYTCSFCNKGFTSVYKLRQHRNMHTGLRPYRCVACTKDFTNYSNWCKHLQKIHKIDPKTIKKPVHEDKNAKVKIENVFTEENSENASDVQNNLIEIDTVSVMPDNIDISHELEGDGLMGESGMKETYMFMEPVNEVVDLDSINPSIAPGTVAEFTVLPPAATFVSDPELPSTEAPLGMPLEYGPDFAVTDCAGLLHLDDHMLPHIDPLLTIKDEQWEPIVFASLQGYGERAKHQAFINTDIF